MRPKHLLYLLTFKLVYVPALAADPELDYFAMSPAELATVQVSIASGTPRTVSQSASVTSVITAEQIKAMGATELHEVLETIPGMHAAVQGFYWDYRYTLRGMQNTTNSELLFLLDGTRLTTPYSGSLTTGTELPLEGIQRIEVIRGPGSALYGADAFAGVVNIITKKSADIPKATLGVRSGNWDTQSAWGQYAADLAGWAMAGSFQFQHSQGDNDRIIQADAQTQLDKQFNTHASLAPGPLNTRYESYTGHLNLTRKYWQMSFWAFGAEGGTRAGATNVLDPKGSGSSQQFLSDLRYSSEDLFDQLELTAHLSHLHADFEVNFVPFPKNTLLPFGADGNISFSQPVGLVYFPEGTNAITGRTVDVPSIELGSVYKGWQQHIARFNISYRYELLTTSFFSNMGAGAIDGNALLPPPNINVVLGAPKNLSANAYSYLPDTHRSVWSAAAQDEWRFHDDWLLTTGLRYDYYSDFGSTVNPRLALLWDINEQLTSRWLFGRAFRAPSFSELGNINNPAQMGNKNLTPETIDTVEWALDYHPSRSLRLAHNFFYYQLHDYIGLVPDAGKPSVSFKNSSEQDGYGSEFEWNWQINEQWNLAGNYAWQHSQNTSTLHRITGIPTHHIFVAGTWQFLPQWQLQSQLNWVAGRDRDAGDTRPLDDYQTVDFIIRSKKLFGHLNVSAVLKNAFDSRYTELGSISAPTNIPMPGRSFYFEVAVQF
ncbi:MAG: TonB-dependent receptor [Methylococcales bacterium]